VGSGKPEMDLLTVTSPAAFANLLVWQVQN
jgi:hypothetical protein